MSESTDWNRVKIAEACGYRKHPDQVKWDWIRPDGRSCIGNPLPDYFRDLNACREMEATLDRSQQSDYLRFLALICSGLTDAWLSIHATAAQRAEAFGLTLGLWKPGQTEP